MGSGRSANRVFRIDEKPELIFHWENELKPDSDLISLIEESLAEIVPELETQEEESTSSADVQPAAPVDVDAPQSVLKALISLSDSVERLMQAAQDQEEAVDWNQWVQAVEIIHRRLLKLLAYEGVEAMDCLENPIDFDRHEVIEYRPTDTAPGDTVIQEIQKGFMWKGRVFRPAKVIVAQNDQ
jgi:molecular chaperone GrpE